MSKEASPDAKRATELLQENEGTPVHQAPAAASKARPEGASSGTDRLRSDPRFDAAAVSALRARAQSELPPDAFATLTEEDLTRFVVARCGVVDDAFKQLKGATAWRSALMAEASMPLSCPLCEQRPTSHSHIPIGLEGSEQSTIVYGCPARATDREVDATVNHVGLQLEFCFGLPETGSRWVWCVDYTGFGLTHASQGQLAARFATLFSNHMPERMHRIILLNPPVVFQVMLKAVRPFVDPVTLDKIVPLRGSVERIIGELRSVHAFPPTALSWLETVLNQKVREPLPPLPAAAAGLMLPGLRGRFDFECEVAPPLVDNGK